MAANPQDIKIKIDFAIDKAATATSIKEVNKAIKELQGLAIQIGDDTDENFKIAQKAAAEFQDQIEDLNENIKAVKGDSIEALAGSFGQLKDGLLSLDFDKASAGATNLAESIRNFNIDDISAKFDNFKLRLNEAGDAITAKFGPAAGKTITGLTNVVSGLGKTALSAISGNFKGAIQGLGQSFQGLGQIIKANPLLLLIGVITTLIANFDKLKNVGGALGTVFTGIGKIVDGVTQAFTDLTDAIGLTDIAGQKQSEEAERNLKAQQVLAKDLRDTYADILRIQNAPPSKQQQAAFENSRISIAEAEAALDKTVESLNKAGGAVENYKKTVTNGIIAVNATVKSNGMLTKEQIEAFQTGLDALNKLYQEDAKLGAQTKQEQIKQQRERFKNNREATAALIKDERQAAKVRIQNEEADAIATLEARYGSNAKDRSRLEQTQFEEEALNIRTIYKRKQEQSDIEFDKKAKEKRDAVNKKNVNETLQGLKSEYEELKAQDDNYNQAKVDYLNNLNEQIAAYLTKNRKVLELNQKELAKLITDLKLDSKANQKKLDDNIVAEKKAASELKVITAKNLFELTEAKKAAVTLQAETELKTVKAGSEQEKLIKAQLVKDLIALDKQYTDSVAQNVQRRLDIEAGTAASKANRIGSQENQEDAVKASYDAEYAALEGQRQASIDSGMSELAAKEAFDNAEIELEKSKQQQLIDIRRQKNRETLSMFANLTDGINQLTNAIFDYKINRLEKGSAEERKAAKKQFNINKGLQLGLATITGVQSVMAAYANGMKNPVPLLGPATGAAYAVIAGISAAANIAKIAATKFDENGSGGSSGGSAISGQGPLSGSVNDVSQKTGAISQPMLYNLGNQTGYNRNNAFARVTLVESDVTGIQNKIQNIESGTYITRKK